MMIDFRKKPDGYDQGMYNMTFDEYCEIPALNSSKLKHVGRSPAHYVAEVEKGDPEFTAQVERSLAKGSAFDTYILNGGIEAVKEKSAVEPDNVNRRKKDYQEWKEAQKAAGKIILTVTEFENVIKMADAAFSKKQFSRLFNKGYAHRVIVWQDQRTGLWCKAEIDWITEDGTVVDLKTTADAGFWFFSKNARRLGYPNQGAHYLKGISAVTGVRHHEFLLAAVEVDPPFESRVFKPSTEQMDRAFDQNEDRMDTLLGCLNTGEWPGYPDLIMDLDTGHYYDDMTDEEEGETYGF